MHSAGTYAFGSFLLSARMSIPETSNLVLRLLGDSLAPLSMMLTDSLSV